MSKPKPNTVLPEGGELIDPVEMELGSYVKLTYDAKVEMHGVTWYRVKGGLGQSNYRRTHEREDWVADIPRFSVSVHDYEWNGSDFGNNYSSMSEAMADALQRSLKWAEARVKETEENLEKDRNGLRSIKDVLGVRDEKPSHGVIDFGELSKVMTKSRLKAALDGGDNWGKLTHSFEYLTACSALLNAWPDD